MAKAIVGAALIAAGAIAILTIPGAGVLIGSELIAVEVASLSAVVVGTTMDLSSIADALTNTPTTPQTMRSPSTPWKAVYGNIRTGGTIIDCNSYGANFHYLDMVIALACHPTNGVQLHTEVIAGDATFPAFGGLYINGQGVQWRCNAQGGSGVPGSIGYDINGTPFGYASSNSIQDLNQNHVTFGSHVYMEAYNGTGKSYNNGSEVNNQVSQFYISQGPADHWNDNCTMMIDVGTSAYTGGTTESPIYANEQGVPKGITYAYLRLLYASTLWAGGLPTSLRFDMQGKNDIWDPRLNSGAGGYGYTNNAALVTADYLTNPYFGMGFTMAEINQAQLIAAANICDTAIPLASGGSVAEYTINGAFDTSQNPANTLQTMLAAMGGDISYVGGQWYIFPGTYVFPTATITPSMLIGPMDISLSQKPRNLINSVKGSFICPAAIDTLGSPNIFLNEQPNIFNGQWQSQPYPSYAMDSQHGYSSDVWLAADGQKLYKEVSFPFTTNAATCQRLAKQALMKTRTGNGLDDSQNKGLSFSVDCNLSAYDIVAHDTVWFDYPRFNWTAPSPGFNVATQDIPEYTYTEFKVVNTSYRIKVENGKPPVPVYTLQLRATSPDVYLWNPADELPMTENKYPQFTNTMQVAGPTSLTAVSDASTAVVNPDGTQSAGVLASWTAPADGYVLNGGELIVQVMPVISSAQTYTSTAITGGGVDNVIVLSGSTNAFTAGENLLLAGGGIGGTQWNGTVYSVSGQTVTLLIAPPTAVTNGAILGAGWQTVAKLSGSTNQYLITGLVDGDQYYVQVYAQNSAGITSTPVIAGPVTVTNGNTTGLIPYLVLPNPVRTAIAPTGLVQNVNGVAAATVVQGATGTNVNLVPDSSLNFDFSFWSNPGAAWSIGAGAGLNGVNAFVATSAASGLDQYSESAQFNLIAGNVYTLSAYIDATHVTAGTPEWVIYTLPVGGSSQAVLSQAQGQKGITSETFTFSPSGVAVGTAVPVVLLFGSAACTFTGNIVGSSPMLQAGSAATAYLPDTVASSTTASTALTNAATAAENAATAQAAANTANTLLGTITGTSLLTPGQKASIIPDYNALIAAQSANDTQAALVGVSSAAYDSALSTLTTYLGTLTSPVAWNVTTNYTTINGTTFANDFEAVYAAENALLNAIANAINSTAATAAASVALTNPNFATGNTGWTLGTDWTIASGSGYGGSGNYAVFNGTGTSAISNKQTIPCAAGSVISSACMANITSGATATNHIFLSFYTPSGTLISTSTGNTPVAGAWSQSRVVATAPANTGYCVVGYGVVGVVSAANYFIIGGFTVSILPNSLAEVPNDPTGVYNKPVGITTGGQATTASIASGAVSSAISYYTTSAVYMTGPSTLTPLATVTIPTDGGFVDIRGVLEMMLTNSIVNLYLYKGTSSGTLLTQMLNLYVSATASTDVTTTLVIEAIDTTPAASQTYTLYGEYTGTGTVPANYIVLSTLNLKV